MIDTIIQVFLSLGVLAASGWMLYKVVGAIGSLFYETHAAAEKATNVNLAIPTIAAEGVRPALMETITHTLENFGEYPVYCIIDEGADLQEELLQIEGIEVVVVPDEYECNAVAKGRAINYFIETVVDEDEWYGFIDDDNKILDDRFLYEIPYYEERGYKCMNATILPRPGNSIVTFLADHVRLVDDFTSFRTFTGVIHKPYLGLHGELLCAKGDLLKDVTFDRHTIVEDFAFGQELIKRDHKVWQSETYISILSAHTVKEYWQQRRRWYLGIGAWLPNSPTKTQAITWPRMAIWTFGICGNLVFFPLWFTRGGLDLPVWLFAVALTAAALYLFVIVVGAVRLSGPKGLLLVPLLPVCALMEHLAPIYSLVKREGNFVVIDK